MKFTLGRKLFLYTVATLILVLLATFFVLERTQAGQWESYLRGQSIAFARLATPEVLKLFRGDITTPLQVDFGAISDFLGLNRDLVRFSLVATDGRELYISPLFPGYAGIPIPETIGAVPAERLEQEQTTVEVLKLADGRRLLDLVTPALGREGTQILSVRYLISYNSVDRRLDAMRRRFLAVAAGSVLLSILLAAAMSRRLNRPIQQLTAGVRAIGQGDLQTQIRVAGRDEISTLGRAFNEMAENLSQHRRALTEKNLALTRANLELREIQEQLLRSERLAAIGQLAAGVSHEIDNPVGIILGHAELLLEDLPPDDSRREDVRAIIDECRRCRRITGGLLGLARSAPGEKVLVDLPGLVDSVFASLRPQKLFRGVALRLRAEPQLPPVWGDTDHLRQVLVNLLLNGAQAMQGEGAVLIRLSVEGEEVVVRVQDTGPGVPEAMREKIFEPFVTTKGREEGTGLGLSLCRKLIEDHGGRLELEASEKGACFRLLLPAARGEKSFDKTDGVSLG